MESEFETTVRTCLKQAAQKFEELSHKPLDEINQELVEATKTIETISQEVVFYSAWVRTDN